MRHPANVLKSGLVVSINAPYLGVSPDGKVIDSGCLIPLAFRRSSVPKQNFWYHPWMLVLMAIFFWKIEMVN